MIANRRCVIINDLAALPSCQDKEYIKGWPYMRFYAEVPIKTASEIVIGSYCIVDNKPRQGLDDVSLEKLQEVASTIVHHLELLQAQKTLQRSREMVKALGCFVEGKPTLHQWWTDAFNGQVDKPGGLKTDEPEPAPTFK